ncbi:MAG: MFS transporter [Thiomonas sp.]
MERIFRSLRGYNYRLWIVGTTVSNIGTWMQRIAQDWLVLTELTPHSGLAVGIVMSLQFGPPILLMSVAGVAADRCDRRKLLMFTQSALAISALGLGVLVLTGLVSLWQVYVFAGITGCIGAFDAPARQTFVAELVGDADLSNAVALNSTSFNAAQLIGPALAGLMIAATGPGWVFVFNALSFVAVLLSLMKMRTAALYPAPRAYGPTGSLAATLRYIWHQPTLVVALGMLFVLGTYGLNFPIFISTMSVTAFHGGPSLYGTLSSAMAVGSIFGALVTASRRQPTVRMLVSSAVAFGVAGSVAAALSSVWLFGLLLAALGATAQLFTTSTNSLVQLSTDPPMRGRVMAIYMGIFLGCTPLGAPLLGWVADAFGPRWALSAGAASGFAAALIALVTRQLPQQHPATPPMR